MTDAELVYIYQTERNVDAKNILIEKYEKLFKYTCFKILQQQYYSIPIEYQDLDLIIYEAFEYGINNFDLKQQRYDFKQSMYTISTSHFKHEAKKYTTNRHYILNNYYDFSKCQGNLKEEVDLSEDLVNKEYHKQQWELVEKVLANSTKLIKSVVYYRSLGYANREIAKILNLNTKKIANTMTRIKKEFKFVNIND